MSAQGNNRKHNGFAAFCDLHDSTFAWNLDAERAERIIGALKAVVQSVIVKPKLGRIGNFTGDGFLLLFENADDAIRSLAGVIEAWEPKRIAFRKEYEEEGWPFADELGLMLRTGVASGFYYALEGWIPEHFAGPAINKAQRCEAASKRYFAEKAGEVDFLPTKTHRVFVTDGVLDNVPKKTAYHISKQLSTELPGITHGAKAAEPGTKAMHYVYALWPKAAVARTLEKKPSKATTPGLIEAESKIDTGDALHQSAMGTVGRPRSQLLKSAIAAYNEALESLTPISAPVAYARAQHSLGVALLDQAELLAGGARARGLEEAAIALREAMQVRTLESAPSDYASTQNSLGNVLRDQAQMVTGNARSGRLDEAVAAYREALSVWTFEADPAGYAGAQNNLGNVLGEQAAIVEGKERARYLDESIGAYREALRLRTYEADPEGYATTQNNLGIGLKNQSRLLVGAGRMERLEQSVASYREALRVRTYDADPDGYATTQNNLGVALMDVAEANAGAEKMRILDEAAAALRNAERVWTPNYHAYDNARVLNNLAHLAELQAKEKKAS